MFHFLLASCPTCLLTFRQYARVGIQDGVDDVNQILAGLERYSRFNEAKVVVIRSRHCSDTYKTLPVACMYVRNIKLVYKYVSMYICMSCYVCMYVSMYIVMYARMYIHTYIYM